MGKRNDRIFVVCALIATAFASIGCGPNSATVHYAQIGACNGYKDTSSSIVSAGSNAAFVVFRVDSIDNTNSSVVFNFDPSRLSVNGASPSANIDPGLSLASTMGVFQAPPESVPAKQMKLVHGFAVATVGTSGGNPATQANQINYFLSYGAASGDPSVLPVKSNSSQTSYPGNDNCLAMSYPLSLEQMHGANLQASSRQSPPAGRP